MKHHNACARFRRGAGGRQVSSHISPGDRPTSAARIDPGLYGQSPGPTSDPGELGAPGSPATLWVRPPPVHGPISNRTRSVATAVATPLDARRGPGSRAGGSPGPSAKCGRLASVTSLARTDGSCAAPSWLHKPRAPVSPAQGWPTGAVDDDLARHRNEVPISNMSSARRLHGFSSPGRPTCRVGQSWSPTSRTCSARPTADRSARTAGTATSVPAPSRSATRRSWSSSTRPAA